MSCDVEMKRGRKSGSLEDTGIYSLGDPRQAAKTGMPKVQGAIVLIDEDGEYVSEYQRLVFMQHNPGGWGEETAGKKALVMML